MRRFRRDQDRARGGDDKHQSKPVARRRALAEQEDRTQRPDSRNHQRPQAGDAGREPCDHGEPEEIGERLRTEVYRASIVLDQTPPTVSRFVVAPEAGTSDGVRYLLSDPTSVPVEIWAEDAGWEIEARDSRAWQKAMFSKEAVATRRAAINADSSSRSTATNSRFPATLCIGAKRATRPCLAFRSVLRTPASRRRTCSSSSSSRSVPR